jgi:hypothetical protein
MGLDLVPPTPVSGVFFLSFFFEISALWVMLCDWGEKYPLLFTTYLNYKVEPMNLKRVILFFESREQSSDATTPSAF